MGLGLHFFTITVGKKKLFCYCSKAKPEICVFIMENNGQIIENFCKVKQKKEFARLAVKHPHQREI